MFTPVGKCSLTTTTPGPRHQAGQGADVLARATMPGMGHLSAGLGLWSWKPSLTSFAPGLCSHTEHSQARAIVHSQSRYYRRSRLTWLLYYRYAVWCCNRSHCWSAPTIISSLGSNQTFRTRPPHGCACCIVLLLLVLPVLPVGVTQIPCYYAATTLILPDINRCMNSLDLTEVQYCFSTVHI